MAGVAQPTGCVAGPAQGKGGSLVPLYTRESVSLWRGRLLGGSTDDRVRGGQRDLVPHPVWHLGVPVGICGPYTVACIPRAVVRPRPLQHQVPAHSDEWTSLE